MATPRNRPAAKDTEYGGLMGPAGVPVRRPKKALSASDEARLMRLTGTRDPAAPISDRVWNGQSATKSPRELEGEARS